MSDHEDVLEGEPPIIDPYEVLDIERTATIDDIKRAYRKAALRHHPGEPITCFYPNATLLTCSEDKAPANDSRKLEEAKKKFQEVAFANAILSDPKRRKRYDETGSTSESIVDADGFNWSEYYREAFKDAISANAIEEFAKQYKGSDEEKDDLLHYFELCEGEMDLVYEHVLLSDMAEDEQRFRKIIDDAIKKREVPAFGSYHRETPEHRAKRIKKAKQQKAAEAEEAEEFAKELGVHDQLFGDGKGEKKKAGKGKKAKDDDGEDALKALIQKRQQDRSGDDFFDRLADKYAPKGKKGKKRAVTDEPSEEAFAATAARMSSKGAPSTPKRSKR